MQFWRKWLLGCYYYTSLPWRQQAARRRSLARVSPVMVLYYHRVADESPNPWTISNARFERQLDWLRNHFELISLSEAQRRIGSNDSPQPAVAITFDDGYADNCAAALPLLIRHQIPCTYFVTSKNILEGEPFVHDLDRGQPLRPNTPEQIRTLAEAGIEIGNHTRTHVDLATVATEKQLQDEIVTAGNQIGLITGVQPQWFAFPYGMHANLNRHAVEILKSVGYRGFCSAYGGYNFPGDDPFHLQRFHGDPELLRIKNCMTVDPRKLRSVRRFEYENLARATGEPVEIGS